LAIREYGCDVPEAATRRHASSEAISPPEGDGQTRANLMSTAE
jgi:hypothetical protein